MVLKQLFTNEPFAVSFAQILKDALHPNVNKDK